MSIYFGDKIKDARKAAGLTQRQLADKIGVSNTSISNWEKNLSRPDPDTIQHLCWALNVQPNYFFSVENSTTIPDNIIPMPEMRQIPLIGTIACGQPILADEHIEAYVDVPRNIKADYALTCKGDSMINARIFPGDIVYIRQQDQVENGEIAAVLIDNEATLKRIRLYDDHIVLEPENPQYRPLSYWGEEMNHLRILGKAVAFTSSIR
ncbi:MAG: helix-turn-helix domain-containing protein [Oscillospiraceae bacterium]|nr:helix-turn-helix domain-containing protein [Oscillospiraceae bacterium]